MSKLNKFGVEPPSLQQKKERREKELNSKYRKTVNLRHENLPMLEPLKCMVVG
jgi:hypothetical protein